MPDFVTPATPISSAVLSWFAETTLVASAFAALILVACRVRWLAPGPAARHALWLLILVKLVTPPLIHWPWSLAELAPMASFSIATESPLKLPEALDDQPGTEPIAMIETSLTEVVSEIEDRSPWSWTGWAVWVVSGWLVGSVVLGLFQASRIARFAWTLGESYPAPDWLIDDAESVGLRMGVRVPEIRVVSGLGTPLVWCLGRPVLLVPVGLLKTLEPDRWRAIVAHELAHLRRGDHWVRRLELVAGLGWWWCPLYWWVCRKLDFEAELACDAWVVWESPRDRLSYAESLIRIGTKLSLAASPRPALGVVGTGRSFERRLTMILNDCVERRVSVPSLVLATLFAALALPSWTFAGPSVQQDPKPSPNPVRVSVVVSDSEVRILDDEDDDDDDDDDDKDRPAKKPKVKKAEKKVDKDDDDDDDKDRPAKKRMKKAEKSADKKAEKPAVDSESMEKLRQKIELQMQAKFGPDSDFQKKMEALAKDMAAKIGDGSDFAKKAKKLETLGKEMEEKFGADSEFAKEIEKMVKETTGKFDADSKKAKVRTQAKVRVAKEEDAEAKAVVEVPKPKVEMRVSVRRSEAPAQEAREQRIQAIQAAIEQLQQELKALKDDSGKSEKR